MRTPLFLGLALMLVASAPAQQAPQLKARELFYTPIAEAPKDAPKAAAVKPSKPKPNRPATKEAEPTYSAAKEATPPPPTPPTSPDGTQVQHAAQVVGPPLALKYRLLKRSADGRYDEVDTDTVFRSGEAIRVSVESNDAAYLYIVQQGASKNWDVLFPNENTEGGSNHVQRNREHEIPSQGLFRFHEPAGTERLFIVLARKPQADLEKLIYSLSQRGDSKKPGTNTSEKPKEMMMAQNRIDESVIDAVRGKVLARDLVFEKVSDDVPVTTSGGTRKEKALYVATPDRSVNATIIVDLALKHQ